MVAVYRRAVDLAEAVRGLLRRGGLPDAELLAVTATVAPDGRAHVVLRLTAAGVRWANTAAIEAVRHTQHARHAQHGDGSDRGGRGGRGEGSTPAGGWPGEA